MKKSMTQEDFRVMAWNPDILGKSGWQGAVARVTRNPLDDAKTAIARYKRHWGEFRIKAHMMKLLILCQMVWDYSETLCDCLVILRNPETRKFVREIRESAREFHRQFRGDRMEYNGDLNCAFNMAVQFERKLGGPNGLLVGKLKEGLLAEWTGHNGQEPVAVKDVAVALFMLLAAEGAIERYAEDIDAEFAQAGVDFNRSMMLVPRPVTGLHTKLLAIQGALGFKLTHACKALLEECVGEYYSQLLTLGVYRHPVRDTYGLFEIPAERRNSVQGSPKPPSGSFVLVCWRTPRAKKFTVGTVLKVRSASREKDGSVLLRTDEGLMGSHTYDWAVL